ncbi:SPFH domain-containing protein [Globicatella sulfidifaciens]|uniref:Membrane protease subunits, stomatin/prohibitin homologs n=3 Tax=Globicatella sulfidifaciens TaxID=136093 RepID=A0A1T4JLY6_9LACT|nr:SPFH domain-containing protein [Globicatella sulfidifaciens]MDT2767998.1 SPFH domain-containing protein [Globicatella sulfidifaciens]SJZ31172.1 Membrane protease subunits, stomatin/prohibitin homologs [Globicatella sulfidifaciens DSM 15739]
MNTVEKKLSQSDNIEEIQLKGKNKGFLVLGLYFALLLVSIVLFIVNVNVLDKGDGNALNIALLVISILYWALGWIMLLGLKVLKPQESLVLTLFGKYIGTLKGEGFYFVNPFSQSFNPAANTKLSQSGDVKEENRSILKTGSEGVSVDLGNKKISLKVMTLNNSKQKINDYLGNPVEIGIAVMWKVNDTAKAVFNVDNFKEYLSLQTDSALRNIIRQYPYDVNPNFEIDTTGDGEPDDGSLRGSSEVVASRIKDEIQRRVEFAGLEIIEARITHLSYAPEIAAAMLQRQQASALIDARAMIVDGAVGMVEMALDKLQENNVVELDEERKAAMVSNLLVVLCGNSEVSPIVNSGSLY